MDNRMKELIAIGASITAICQPCLEYHVAKAHENGAAEEEIRDAIAVGKIVRKGAAGKLDRFASTVCRDAADCQDKPDDGGGCRLT